MYKVAISHIFIYTSPVQRYNIGTIIKEFRNRKNINQEDLCSNLCAISTLSKIESGKCVPHELLARALLERLDLPSSLFIFPCSEEELERRKIEEEINRRISFKIYNYDDLLEKYKNIAADMNIFEKQFYLWAKSENKPNLDKKEILYLSTEAIKLTIKNFDFNIDLYNNFFTLQELKIINSISFNTDSILLLSNLIKYFEIKKYDDQEYKDLYINILYNITLKYFRSENYTEGIIYCNRGLEYIKANMIFNKLLDFSCLRGYMLIYLNNKEEGIKELINTLLFQKESGNYNEFHLLSKDIENRFGRKFYINIQQRVDSLAVQTKNDFNRSAKVS